MKRGFTLIELLLVIGIMAILAGLAVPITMNFYRSQSVEFARSQLIETLSRARHNAVLMKGDSRYGVYITPADISSEQDLVSFTLYKGNDYASSQISDSDYNEVYELPPNLIISAAGSDEIKAGDINFTKLFGLTPATGTITIRHGSGAESRTMIIDDFGNAYATST